MNRGFSRYNSCPLLPINHAHKYRDFPLLEEQIDFLLSQLNVSALAQQLTRNHCVWGKDIEQQLHKTLAQTQHGDLTHWIQQLLDAPQFNAPIHATLGEPVVTLRGQSPLSPNQHQVLIQTLKNLKPWRKGPFDLFDTSIDSEWRSDMKWNRLEKYCDLKDHNILDVGCGNGYFGWRMLGAGAQSVTGIEPNLLFITQFLYIKNYINNNHAHFMLPLRFEGLPENLNYFDTVFSMGVLYHRRSVFDHLFELKACLKSGGQLVLETLVIKNNQGEVLVPKDRYACMRNVWFIPNSTVLSEWLERVGFVDVQIIDESDTTIKEQRKTDWIDSQSYEHCLDANNPRLTIEGYPAPRRVVIFARKPN